jgi:hypothetical protein
VRQRHLFQPPIFSAGEMPVARRGLFAAAVEGEHRGIGERRGKKSARLMR